MNLVHPSAQDISIVTLRVEERQAWKQKNEKPLSEQKKNSTLSLRKKKSKKWRLFILKMRWIYPVFSEYLFLQ
ncbi:hypothetical protein K7432_014089 [Basidiobolus ranarum]|uniref:Uncharacterized protein n=1 Tax=Basidiobolus ranarum TaxID=34480 RepID=A0ABR2WIC0_9FUNG